MGPHWRHAVRAISSALSPLIPPALSPWVALVSVCVEEYGPPLTAVASGIVAASITGHPALAIVSALIGEFTLGAALRRKLPRNPVSTLLYSAVGGAAVAPLVLRATLTPLHALIFGLTLLTAFIRPPLAPMIYEKRERYDPWNSIVLAALMIYGLAPLVGLENSCLAFLVAKGVDGAGGITQFIPRSINPVVSLKGFRIREVEEGISPIGTFFEFLAASGLGWLITGSARGALVMGIAVTAADILSNVTGVEDHHKGDDLLMMLSSAWVIQTFGVSGLMRLLELMPGW
ncbi:hypothetical protein [Methanopyrus sp. KOL6]|uniref:hypothetical protein n=1 Tax=Methanopyrus sp. KOL6 TaxID=1937004 RepID=UPI0012F8D61A|nr:hypothetical protein [Methanopyrus sp. KOL6]